MSTRHEDKDSSQLLVLGPGVQFYHTLCQLKAPLSKYKLPIPETFCVGDAKLLCFDPIQDCLGKAMSMMPGQFQEHVAREMAVYIQSKQGVEDALDEPAYMFHTVLMSKQQEIGTRTVAKLVTNVGSAFVALCRAESQELSSVRHVRAEMCKPEQRTTSSLPIALLLQPRKGTEGQLRRHLLHTRRHNLLLGHLKHQSPRQTII